MEKPISLKGIIFALAIVTVLILLLIKLYQEGYVKISFPAPVKALRNFSIKDYSYFQGEYNVTIIVTKELYVERVNVNEDDFEINQIKKLGEEIEVSGKTIGKEINFVVYYKEDDFPHSTYTTLPERT